MDWKLDIAKIKRSYSVFASPFEKSDMLNYGDKLVHTGLTVDSSQVTFLPTSKSLDTKTRPNITNPASSNLDIVT